MGFCPSEWRDILWDLSSDMIQKAWPCATRLLAEGEGLCSTQVEPSPTPHYTQDTQQDAPIPQANEQGQAQDSPLVESTPIIDVAQPSGDPTPIVDQVQVQDGHDSDDEGDDQAISRESLEEMLARRAKRRHVNLECVGHTEDKIIGMIRGRVATRRQLVDFSKAHACVSFIEPKKFYEALEDQDWLEDMHYELNNSSATRFGS